MSHQQFLYKNFEFNPNTGELKLSYSVDDRYNFQEVFNFTIANSSVFKRRYAADINLRTAIQKACWALHLMAGISYYKAFLTPTITINTTMPDREEATFFEKFFLYGLGEFAYRNNLDLKPIVHFPSVYDSHHQATAMHDGNDNSEPTGDFSATNEPTYLIAVGGGKDSAVSIEILKELIHNNRRLAVCYCSSANPPAVLVNSVQQAQLLSLPIKRQISPLLISINQEVERHHAYNGHVPITAINSFACLLNALINNYSTVIFSNERSANVGNVEHHGMIANHQWSKSWEAEQLMHNFWEEKIVQDVEYMSLLRPLSEMAIAKIFAQKCREYFYIFSSCNRNFKLFNTSGRMLWCNNCDKCRFVFLILAAFINKTELINIFGSNLLNDPEQLEGYRELLGLSGHKPFECVGEIEEARAAIGLILQRGEYQEDAGFKQLCTELQALGYHEEQFHRSIEQALTPDFQQGYLELNMQTILQRYL